MSHLSGYCDGDRVILELEMWRIILVEVMLVAFCDLQDGGDRCRFLSIYRIASLKILAKLRH